MTHVFGILDRGGAETVSLDICRAVPSDEVAQTFLALGGREGSLADEFRAAGAEVRQCPLRPLHRFPLRLWSHLRGAAPDAIVSHVGLASGVVLLIGWAARIPVRVARIWSEGDGCPDTPARRIRRRILRGLLRLAATEVLGVTAAALAFARPGLGTSRYGVLYNSVDTRRVEGWDRADCRSRWKLPAGAPVLVHLGRAIPDKNRPFLIEIHRALRAMSPDAILLAAGPGGIGDLAGRHPDITREPGLLLLGEVDEIGPVLAAADVLLLPSKREGLPGVVLEALAAGLPVVASDLPCLREVARHTSGLTLLSLADRPDRWADAALRSARAGPELRERIQQNLRSSPFLVQHAVAEWRARWNR